MNSEPAFLDKSHQMASVTLNHPETVSAPPPGGSYLLPRLVGLHKANLKLRQTKGDLANV